MLNAFAMQYVNARLSMHVIGDGGGRLLRQLRTGRRVAPADAGPELSPRGVSRTAEPEHVSVVEVDHQRTPHACRVLFDTVRLHPRPREMEQVAEIGRAHV